MPLCVSVFSSSLLDPNKQYHREEYFTERSTSRKVKRRARFIGQNVSGGGRFPISVPWSWNSDIDRERKKGRTFEFSFTQWHKTAFHNITTLSKDIKVSWYYLIILIIRKLKVKVPGYIEQKPKREFQNKKNRWAEAFRNVIVFPQMLQNYKKKSKLKICYQKVYIRNLCITENVSNTSQLMNLELSEDTQFRNFEIHNTGTFMWTFSINTANTRDRAILRSN